MKIAIVYSLPTKRMKKSHYIASDEDAEYAARLIHGALLSIPGLSVQLIPVGEDSLEKISHIHADCIINIIEWTGEDLPLSVDAISRLEKIRIPFTGATRNNWENTTNKVLMKQLFDVHRVPTARWQVFSTGKEKVHPDFHYPLFVKLAYEHSGIGLHPSSRVSDKKSLVSVIRERIGEFSQPVIVEEYISGREFEVTLLEVDGTVMVLPIAENIYDPKSPVDFLTYDGRWQENFESYLVYRVKIAELDKTKQKEIERECERVFYALEFRDYARFDIRMNQDGRLFFLETNSNPGIDDNMDIALTVSFRAAGLTLSDFVLKIVESSMTRFRRPKRLVRMSVPS